MAVLVHLANRSGEAVTREELENEVWRGLVVGYDALSNTISKLRKAFGDDRKQPKFIETIPKVGYRLIAEVGTPTSSPINEYPASDPNLERKLAAILYADVAITVGLPVHLKVDSSTLRCPLQHSGGA